jgi:hypothetical protein
MRRKSIAAFRVSRNVAGNGELFPAIGFLAVKHRHVGSEVAAGLKDAACCHVSVRISAIVTADSGIVTGGVCRGGLRGSQYRFLN